MANLRLKGTLRRAFAAKPFWVMVFLGEHPPYVKRSLSRMASATHCRTLPERCAHRLYEPISHNTQWVALSVVTYLRRRDMSTASRKFDTVQRQCPGLAARPATHDLSWPPSSAECQTVRGRPPLSYPSTTRPLSSPCEAALMLTMMTLIDDLGQQTAANVPVAFRRVASCPFATQTWALGQDG